MAVDRRRVALETVSQDSATAGDSRLDRPDGDLQNGGDLRVIEVGDVAEDHRGAELLGDLSECLVDGYTVADGIDPPFGGRIDDLGCGLMIEGVQRRTTLPFTNLVECGVGGDAVGPGSERGATVEPGQAADDLDHRLLTGIVGVPVGAGDSPADPVDPVVVTTQQVIQRDAISALSGSDQVGVVELGSDPASVPTGFSVLEHRSNRSQSTTWISFRTP